MTPLPTMPEHPRPVWPVGRVPTASGQPHCPQQVSPAWGTAERLSWGGGCHLGGGQKSWPSVGPHDGEQDRFALEPGRDGCQGPRGSPGNQRAPAPQSGHRRGSFEGLLQGGVQGQKVRLWRPGEAAGVGGGLVPEEPGSPPAGGVQRREKGWSVDSCVCVLVGEGGGWKVKRLVGDPPP